MASKTQRHTRVGRAGWLFADLSIILMIIFASTTIKADSPRCDGANKTNPGCPSATTTTLPPTPPGGFRPKPLEVIIWRATSMSATQLADALEAEVKTAKDMPSDVYFGVVLIYGGSKNKSTKVGDRAAINAQQKLAPGEGASQNLTWKRIKSITYFTTGHDSDYSQGAIKFKLFPVVREQ